jgi:carboxypeptidase Taq
LSPTAERPAERFLRLWSEVADLGKAAEVLGWDQETYMPPKGQAARARLLGTLAALRHERMVSAKLRDAIEAAAQAAEPASALAAQAREARRIVTKLASVPTRLARELAEARSNGQAVWQEARREADFARFRPALERVFELTREAAQHMALDASNPYDALLDDYEPGTTTAELAPLFERLRASLAAMVQAVVGSGVVVDERPVRGHYPPERQLAFCRAAAEGIGFDFEAGRLDRAVHPFCSGFDPGDVRITWRWMEEDFRSGLFGVLHEAGHGLYEQGLPREWQRTPIGDAASMGLHESQSRLWENQVGRSRAFWRWALPLLHEQFPDKRALGIDELWPTLNAVQPSLIRVEADEGTYDLHIAIRFDLERALFADELAIDELPGAWNDAYEELLGIRPANDAEGVLQDLHWSAGAFGYFPTYTLGNMMKAQLYTAARRDLGDLDSAFARGEFAPLLEWLRDRVHRHGARFRAKELVERASGRPLSADDHLAARAATVEAVYGVTV